MVMCIGYYDEVERDMERVSNFIVILLFIMYL